MQLVLSLFSGLGVLDEGFRQAGYCVVSAGDLVCGSLYDVREFHPPTGKFDGVIGGDPCQAHSALANLVRAKGLEPSFGDLSPEFERIVTEAQPAWFLRENVPKAPDIKPEGYTVASFLLDHSTLDSGDGTGHEQMRRRRFWFGQRGNQVAELRRWIRFALVELPDASSTVCHEGGGAWFDDRNRKRSVTGSDGVPPGSGSIGRSKVQAICADARREFIPGGQAEVDAIRREKRTAVTSTTQGPNSREKVKHQTVSGRHESDGMGGTPSVTPGNNAGNPPRYSLAEMLELQGLPKDLLDHAPFTMQGKRKLVGNAVALPMARALAKAVRKATE